jgi:hypothetical protein
MAGLASLLVLAASAAAVTIVGANHGERLVCSCEVVKRAAPKSRDDDRENDNEDRGEKHPR